METLPIEFLQSLAAVHPALKSELNAYIEYWKPNPPPPIVAFAKVGHAVAENLNEIPLQIRRVLFAKIEEGMVSQSNDLKLATGTGLIEALVAECDKNSNLLGVLKTLFGPISLKYAMEWGKFDS